MAAKNKPKSKIKPSVKKEHFEVLLENMNDSIKLVAEGQLAFRQEVNQKFNESDQRLADFCDRTDSNFKTIFDYLARMDDELQDIKKSLQRLDETKIDKAEFAALAQRVAQVEQELKKYRETAPAKN
jgi:DNA repair ATPase RecN